MNFCKLCVSKAKGMALTPAQLQDLAIRQLLSDESFAVSVLTQLPSHLFHHLLSEAFQGGHRNLLRVIVQHWPFTCLHLGSLLEALAGRLDCLEAILEGLDSPAPARGVPDRRPQLRMVDFRPDSERNQANDSSWDADGYLASSTARNEQETTLPESHPRQMGSEEPREPVKLCMNLSLGGFNVRQPFATIWRKVKENHPALILFSQKVHIREKRVDAAVEVLGLMLLESIHELELSVCLGFLSGGSQFARQVGRMKSLRQLTMTTPMYMKYLDIGKVSSGFLSFLSHLSGLTLLRSFHLSSHHISGHLHLLLSYLPAALEVLELPFCDLTPQDICCLSQSLQASSLKKLNLSGNELSSVAPSVLKVLLQVASGTLQELDLSGCRLGDEHIGTLLPALLGCLHLHELNLFDKNISTATLQSLLQHLAGLPMLQRVFCPIPVECFEQQAGRSSVLQQQLNSVKAMASATVRFLQQDLEVTFALGRHSDFILPDGTVTDFYYL